MARRLVNITLDNLSDLPVTCRNCVYWELDPVAGERACENGGTDLEKEAWVSDTLLEWGSCGRVAYVDAVPAGYVLFAPPAYVPRSVAFPTSPVSPDAVLLMTGAPAARIPWLRSGPGTGASRRTGRRESRNQGDRGIRPHGLRRRGATVPAARGLPARRRLQDRSPTSAHAATAAGRADHRVVAFGPRRGDRPITVLDTVACPVTVTVLLPRSGQASCQTAAAGCAAHRSADRPRSAGTAAGPQRADPRQWCRGSAHHTASPDPQAR